MTNDQLIPFLISIGCEAQANDAPSLAFARLILEAMEEPTPEMVAAGQRVGYGHAPQDYYDAMFQARFVPPEGE